MGRRRALWLILAALGGVLLLTSTTGPTSAASTPELELQTEWKHVPVQDRTQGGTDGALEPSSADQIPRWWDLAAGLTGAGALALGLLLRRPGPAPQQDRLSFWESVKLFAADTWNRTVNQVWSWAEWVWYEGLPQAIYGAKVAGLFAAGFVFETVNSLCFGVGAWLLSLFGRSLDDVPDAPFQLGRMAGAKTVELWGYAEMALGVTGKGGGMLVSATGGGALVGLSAMAVSAGFVVVGAGHAGSGLVHFAKAQEAFRRTGGRSIAQPPQRLLTEEEVRKLLGPNATEQAIQRFMRFQEYAAQKLGANIAKLRVQRFSERGLGPVLAGWIEELGPEQAAALLKYYGGDRRLLAAITENRALKRIAAEGNIILKFNTDVGQAGADIIYLNRKTGKVTLVDAKGSFSGSYFGSPTTFSKCSGRS